MGRRLGVYAFLVCLPALLSACGSRTTGTAPPTTPPIDQTTASPTPPVTSAPAAPSAAGSGPPASGVEECALVTAAGPARTEPARDPIATVGLTERIDPTHAPRPINDSERLLFRQLYETLVQADCMGRVVPGLAASWRLDTDRRTWLVTLRDEAQFSDGTPVMPSDVRASWTGDGVDSPLRPEVARLVESVNVTGERTLALRLRSLRVDVPLSLAHPDLAVAKSVTGAAWPLGTRSAVVTEGRAPEITITRDNLVAMRFLVAPGDPRDLIDRGVDLLLTRAPAALDYAATLPSFQAIPLAWQRTHVLLTPGRARGVPSLSDAQREALADDAVRGEARGARGPFWWQMPAGCELPAASLATTARPAQQTPLRTPRVVYDAGDAVARDLGERFVGLVRASGPGATPFLDVLLPDRPRRTYQRATGLSGAALAVARRAGTDAGYVMAVDTHPIDSCRDLQILRDVAPWLDPETIVPLVDTRLHAIVRRGRAGVTAEWDGGLLIASSQAAGGPANAPR